jgi:uncharacterized protein
VPEQPHIAVTGIGIASGIADQCTLRISVNSRASNTADALTSSAEAASKAMAAIDGVDVEQHEVRTTALSVQEFMDRTKQEVTAHIGAYQMEVTVRPVDGAGKVLAALASAVGDALQVRGVQLTIQDLEPLKSEARRLAVQDAKTRARELSEAAGVRLGALLSIEGEQAGSGRSPGAARTMSMSASPAAASVPIEPGDVSAVSTVTLTYALEV